MNTGPVGDAWSLGLLALMRRLALKVRVPTMLKQLAGSVCVNDVVNALDANTDALAG